jgi:hypothetical protein
MHRRQLVGIPVLEIIALLFILVLAGYLRLVNNSTNPGWYADEGTHILIARNLAQGRWQYMAIGQSTLLFAKLPAFELLLALLLRLGGEGIATLRALTGVLGVITVGTLYACVRQIKRDPYLALLSALLLALYPQAGLYSRFGFSYNLIAPLVLLVYLGLWKYLEQHHPSTRQRWWLACAALAIGAGSLSDLWMFTLIPPLVLLITTRHGRDLLWSVPLALLPFGLFALWMLVRSPRAFLFDSAFTLSRFSDLSLAAQIKTLALNYAILVSQDHWTALALVGIFLLRPLRLRFLTLCLLLFPIATLGRTEALVNLSAYYMVPLLPFVSLGVSILLRVGLPYIQAVTFNGLRALVKSWSWLAPTVKNRLLQRHLLTAVFSLFLVIVVLSPFITSTVYQIDQIQHHISTAIDPFLIAPGDGRAVASYLNARTKAEDLVIASPGMAWALDSNTADLQMAIAFEGRATPHLPADIPAERFVFLPDFQSARFVVVDNYWYNWAIHNVIGVSDMLDELQSWPLVFEAGAIQVYNNPKGGN